MHILDDLRWLLLATMAAALILPAYFIGPAEDLRDWWRRR